jgi:hypothetical protein
MDWIVGSAIVRLIPTIDESELLNKFAGIYSNRQALEQVNAI